MKPLPKLANLTPDNRVWRLDWFGNCGYPAHIRRYSQPSVKVVLSPLRGDPSDQTALLEPTATDHQHYWEAWAPISTLPLLAIGDLWQDGRQLTSPDYQAETFKSLMITPETTSFVKAGLAIDEHFLLPLSQHPWHRAHTHAYCVAVDLGEGKRLLVPCVELIRFYFGSSGSFIQRLFTQPLEANTLWAEKRFDAVTRHLHLVLAEKLSGASASDIGRIANSKFAWRTAANIFASCQKAAVQRNPVYPYTGFPFEGTTDLAASGLWLPYGEQKDATFLAYRLRSCSHPFPFRSLSYEASDKKVRNSSLGTGEDSKAQILRQFGEIDKAVDIDPAADKRKRAASFGGRIRFPDLARKQVWRERFEEFGRTNVFLRREDGILEQVAFGESEGYTCAAGVDVTEVNAEEQKNERLPWFVQEGMRILRSNSSYISPGAAIEVIRPRGSLASVFELPLVVNEDGEIDPIFFVEMTSGRTRARRACIVRSEDSNHTLWHFLIAEGEHSSTLPNIIFMADQQVSNIDFVELIRKIEMGRNR